MSKSSKDSARSMASGMSLQSQWNMRQYAKKRRPKRKKTPKKREIVTDLTAYPAYEKYKMPYYMVCRERYQNTKKEYDEQFLYELKMQEAMQPSAYDAMRFHRHFVITTLWPPLHTKKEIENTLKMYALDKRQEKRLRELMENKLS
uniref:CSON002524 protein n=1 Tax=Culicoides sonorensis TaxID=179676 RepID=A0A336LRY7_CULSO